MNLFKDLTTQLRALWRRWTPTQRTGIVSAAAVSIIVISAVGYWATLPEYVVLADRLAPSQTAEYVAALEAGGIPYKLSFSGSSILVAGDNLSRARMEVRELLDPPNREQEDLAGNLWSDPALHQTRLLRQQESRLARTIERMKSVRTATVHLTQPEPSPFIRQTSATKASVTVELKPGVAFAAGDAAAIVSLIAHSVENLQPENVTVLSTDGRLLSSPQGLSGHVSGQLEYKALLESNLSAKAEALLAPLLGLGNSTVRVTADVDFTQTERTQKTVDPDTKAKLREELRTETFTGESPIASGPAGTSANVQFNTAAGSQSGKRESEDITTEYVNSETTDLIREVPGRIRRITVAAVVQLPEANTANGAAAPPVDRAELESIIKNAVGFDEQRGDQIQVVAATLTGIPLADPPLGFWQGLNESAALVRSLSLGAAALVALVLGLLLIRRMRPVVIAPQERETLSPEAGERLKDLQARMQEHPEIVTTILASWLEGKDKDQQPPAVRRAA